MELDSNITNESKNIDKKENDVEQYNGLENNINNLESNSLQDNTKCNSVTKPDLVYDISSGEDVNENDNNNTNKNNLINENFMLKTNLVYNISSEEDVNAG